MNRVIRFIQPRLHPLYFRRQIPPRRRREYVIFPNIFKRPVLADTIFEQRNFDAVPQPTKRRHRIKQRARPDFAAGFAVFVHHRAPSIQHNQRIRRIAFIKQHFTREVGRAGGR